VAASQQHCTAAPALKQQSINHMDPLTPACTCVHVSAHDVLNTLTTVHEPWLGFCWAPVFGLVLRLLGILVLLGKYCYACYCLDITLCVCPLQLGAGTESSGANQPGCIRLACTAGLHGLGPSGGQDPETLCLVSSCPRMPACISQQLPAAVPFLTCFPLPHGLP